MNIPDILKEGLVESFIERGNIYRINMDKSLNFKHSPLSTLSVRNIQLYLAHYTSCQQIDPCTNSLWPTVIRINV